MKKNINNDDTSLQVYLIHYLAVLIIREKKCPAHNRFHNISSTKAVIEFAIFVVFWGSTLSVVIANLILQKTVRNLISPLSIVYIHFSLFC